jgi:AcrR family transcriptional regulator
MAEENNKSQQRRQEILSAAAIVFDTRGYGQATMDEVARQAGLSKGSIYNYFRSKKELFREVFTAAVSLDERELDKLVRQEMSASEKLSAMLELWYGRLKDYARMGRLVLEFWATAAREERTGETSKWLSTMYARQRETLAQMLADGVRRGEFGRQFDPSVAAALIISLLRGIIVQAIIEGEVRVDREFLSSVRRAILTGLTGAVQQGA